MTDRSEQHAAELAAAVEYAAAELSDAGIPALLKIHELTILRHRIDDYLELAVADAVANGRSWAEISTRLGLSRSSAHQSYARRWRVSQAAQTVRGARHKKASAK